jgi:D-alanyl-lipoteichoic acid acyltransferase DltB (MBOAT superfamily)
MLFNSYEFLVFLLVFLVVFYALDDMRQRKLVVVLFSLFFYGWFYWPYLFLIAGSMVVNYWVGRRLAGDGSEAARSRLLALGIVLNLVLLAYFKYWNFLIENVNALTGIGIPALSIALPLAISFYTFHQIIFLIDVRNSGKCAGLLDYAIYIVFFPQLIAGPLVRSQEIFPQLETWSEALRRNRNLVIGTSVFAIGLAKKCLVADTVAVWANGYFDADWSARDPSFVEAWAGALSYSFQLYFDFSGYSDMALGLALMVGVRLPLNFYSPYKATSIIDFWRRWHITLSRFLRDYLYIVLGGSRLGAMRRYVNLMLTMLIGGLWHGAAWTFVVWGGLHGAMLAVNHLVRGLRPPVRDPGPALWLGKVTATFVLVTLAWVFFRASDLGLAVRTTSAMLGIGGLRLPDEAVARLARFGLGGPFVVGAGPVASSIFFGREQILALAGCAMLCLAFPNTFELMRRARIALDPTRMADADPRLLPVRWRPRPLWMGYVACLLVLAVMSFGSFSPFLYFQF